MQSSENDVITQESFIKEFGKTRLDISENLVILFYLNEHSQWAQLKYYSKELNFNIGKPLKTLTEVKDLYKLLIEDYYADR